MKVGWKMEPLGELCDFQRGLTYAKGDEVDVSKNIVLRANNINLGTNALDFSELKYINDSIVVPKSKKVKKDSLIICTASGSKSHLGKVAFIDDDYDYAFGGFMGMVTPKNGLLPRYLFHVLTSERYKDFIGELSDGANINNLKFDDLSRFTVSYPPRAEQQRIVAILDEAFGGIAAAQANAEKNLQNARALFENHRNDVFRLRRSSWIERRFSEVCEITSALVDPQKEQFLDLLHVGGANIETKTGRLLDLKTAREEALISGKFCFDESTVLYSKIRPYLMKVARPGFKGLCSADIYPLSVKQEQLDRDFLFHLLLSSDFTDYANAGSARVGMPKVNRDYLFAYRCCLPPVGRQKELAAQLDDLYNETQCLESTYQRKLSALDELKKSLLHQAFSGQL